MREELRLSTLQNNIITNGVHQSDKHDLKPDCIILDIGDPLAYIEATKQSDFPKRGAIHTFGGLIGELIITFTCLLDFVLSNPNFSSFKIT